MGYVPEEIDVPKAPRDYGIDYDASVQMNEL